MRSSLVVCRHIWYKTQPLRTGGSGLMSRHPMSTSFTNYVVSLQITCEEIKNG